MYTIISRENRPAAFNYISQLQRYFYRLFVLAKENEEIVKKIEVEAEKKIKQQWKGDSRMCKSLLSNEDYMRKSLNSIMLEALAGGTVQFDRGVKLPKISKACPKYAPKFSGFSDRYKDSYTLFPQLLRASKDVYYIDLGYEKDYILGASKFCQKFNETTEGEELFALMQEEHERIEIEELKKKLTEKHRKERLKKIALMELEEEGILFQKANKRPPIPDDVKDFVYRRDGGKCVMCGSKKNLQFDHIIPFSKGGATSVENLQILCQKCNLKKSNHIG